MLLKQFLASSLAAITNQGQLPINLSLNCRDLETQFLKLTLITENQKSVKKAERFGKMICQVLSIPELYKISKYTKLENSFKIEVSKEMKSLNPIVESIELTDRICSPWSVTYHREENLIELIFNKSRFSSFRTETFNVLYWANLRFENRDN